MKVRYICSACIEIHTENLTILTDPWFSPGAFEGAWHQFPKIDDPFEVISEPDIIYISHIHPDHYDPRFLRKLIEVYGEKTIITANFSRNFLQKKAMSDGLRIEAVEHMNVSGVDIYIEANETGSLSDIDSALFVAAEGNTVLNLNDCFWNAPHVEKLQNIIAKYTDEVDLLALPYTGAGPYPQTYFDLDDPQLLEAADKKKEDFFSRYRRFCDTFPAKHHLPFAGKYMLGGKLAKLNAYRGVADAFEVTQFDNKAVILADAGQGEIDLQTGECSALRTSAYALEEIAARQKELEACLLDYEREIQIPYEKINYFMLLSKALNNAIHRSEVEEDYIFEFHVLKGDEVQDIYSFNSNKNNEAKLYKNTAVGCPADTPKSQYFVDYRHLFGCLTGVYHWNNAEVGSFCDVRRVPNIFNSSAQKFLNFLCV